MNENVYTKFCFVIKSTRLRKGEDKVRSQREQGPACMNLLNSVHNRAVLSFGKFTNEYIWVRFRGMNHISNVNVLVIFRIINSRVYEEKYLHIEPMLLSLRRNTNYKIGMLLKR